MPKYQRQLSQLSAWVAPEVKSAFHAVAHAHGTTESRLLGLLVDVFLDKNAPVDALPDEPTTGALDVKSERVTLRLTVPEYTELLRRAQHQGMTKSAYLAALFRAQVTTQPQFNDAEMQALRKATYGLTAIGRNLNQIARALNSSPDYADRARAVEFETLRTEVERHRQAVKDVIKANLRSWGM